MIEATVTFAEGQSLASFFTHRKSYLTLRDAVWATTGERVENAALKVEQVLWAAAVDGDVALSQVSAAAGGRSIELQLDGGLLLRARLTVSHQQRIGDYLEAASRFLPLLDAQLLRSGRPPRPVNVMLGDIVLNQDGIQAAWEAEAPTLTAASTEAVAQDADASAAEEESVLLLDENLTVADSAVHEEAAAHDAQPQVVAETEFPQHEPRPQW
jgi:hypothetical protein